jgi:hypothetical protein
MAPLALLFRANKLSPEAMTVGVIAITGRLPWPPPSSDPFSTPALPLPLITFYFTSIGIGKLLGR